MTARSVAGATMNRAPASTARAASSAESTVPAPTRAPIPSATRARAAMAVRASSRGSLSVSSMAGTPPWTSAAPMRGARAAVTWRPTAMTRLSRMLAGMAGRSVIVAPRSVDWFAQRSSGIGASAGRGWPQPARPLPTGASWVPSGVGPAIRLRPAGVTAMTIRQLPAPELLVRHDAYVGEGPVWNPASADSSGWTSRTGSSS